MNEDLIVYLSLTPRFAKRAPNIEIAFNGQSIPVPALVSNKECKIEFPTTLKLGDMSGLTITMKDKTHDDNVINQAGEIVFGHGIIVQSIAIGWPLSERDKLFIEWMSDNKGSEDNTGRVDPEYQRQAEAKKLTAQNNTFTRFPLTDTMIKKSCSFLTGDGTTVNVVPMYNRVFEIAENGTFTFSFKAPFAYWALENFI
jgi:hypothetical protein